MLDWLRKRLSKTSDFTMEHHSGVGTLHCNKCKHAEEVHLFTHGFGPTSHCTIGVQCQSCAKFVTFDSEPVGESDLKDLDDLIERSRCECGGIYARDKPVMCPQCKSTDVRYSMDYIT